MTRLKTATCFLLLTACTTEPALGPVEPQGLTREQAAQWLRLALEAQGQAVQGPGCFIDSDLVNDAGEPPHPGFYDLSVGCDSEASGATQFSGLYAVDRASGDIWEINLCEPVHAPILERAQVRLRHATGSTPEQAAERLKGLGCESG